MARRSRLGKKLGRPRASLLHKIQREISDDWKHVPADKKVAFSKGIMMGLKSAGVTVLFLPSGGLAGLTPAGAVISLHGIKDIIDHHDRMRPIEFWEKKIAKEKGERVKKFEKEQAEELAEAGKSG